MGVKWAGKSRIAPRLEAPLKVAALALLLTLALPGPASAESLDITIEVRGKPELHAVFVEPWPQDFVRLTNSKNERTFVPFTEICEIRDADGRDRTKDVLAQRESLGQAPVMPAPSEPQRALPAFMTSFVVGKDSILVASRVETNRYGDVVATRLDGVKQNLLSHRVRWIRWLDGESLTRNVLDHGKTFEQGPILIGYPAGHWGLSSLRGQPKPYRGAFPFVQSGIEGRLDEDGENDPTAIAEFGWMKNVNKQYALGGSAFLAGDYRFTRYGIKARTRRWLTRFISLDAATGFLRAKDGNYPASPLRLGYTGEISLGFADLISVTGSMESSPTMNESYMGGGYYAFVENVQTSWYLGVRFGGEAAIPGFLAASIRAARQPRIFMPSP